MMIGGVRVGATGGAPCRWTKGAVKLLLLAFLLAMPPKVGAQQGKPLEKVRLTVPAKALTLLPYYFGKAKGLFAREGIDLEIIVMRPPLGVTALLAGEVDYAAAGGVSLRAAMKGLPLRTDYISFKRA